MRPGWVERCPASRRISGRTGQCQDGANGKLSANIFLIQLCRAPSIVPEVDTGHWTGARDLFSFYIWRRTEQQQWRWCYLFGGEDFWSGWAGLGWLGWVQEGILNSNLCQDWKTGLNEGRPRGAALPQSYKYFKINFK